MSTTELAWFKSSYSSGSGDDCIEVAVSWRKSSYSSSGDGDCVEVALPWQKSSYSSSSGDDCVEVAACPGTVHVRDSKDKQGPQLALTPTAWRSFLSYASRA
ncbi:DUF397 domain-containing protein [Streptomyces sp. HNM0575]|uniref:DUF397 domain-containing protein n=1 Tax=Streptomyces sp. HNM0575 TaxID=2716338 RepID=UPI00145FB5E6|nr:DUF397 domain-containing protein [Streptomyces sp. HNM0575]NLU71700.1 DUF397 domain-containing protein [Streptomyces sp. HNM0575]